LSKKKGKNRKIKRKVKPVKSYKTMKYIIGNRNSIKPYIFGKFIEFSIGLHKIFQILYGHF